MLPNITGAGWLPTQGAGVGSYDFGAGSILPKFNVDQMGGALDPMSLSDWFKNNGAGGNGAFGTGLGLNVGTGQLALGGLQSLGNLMSSFQASNMAKKQFEFTKSFANANLANQIKSYNTRLEDKIGARAVTQNEAPGWADNYIQKNRLTRDSVG